MTKRDYRAFAEMLHGIYTGESWDRNQSVSAANMLEAVTRGMCGIFARDNSRFDSDRFLTAVREGLGGRK